MDTNHRLRTLNLVTSELMFEQYSVPSLALCVDSVMSFYHNNLPSPPVPFHGDGLVVSFNTASTSVIPILDGKGLMSHAKRCVTHHHAHHSVLTSGKNILGRDTS